MKHLSFLYPRQTPRFSVLCLTFIFIALSGLNGQGQTITSIATGNWNNVDTWLSANLTGRITTTTTSRIVTGTGTTFTTQLAVGSKLYRTNGTTLIGTVEAISNNTSLILTANAANANTGAAFRARKIPVAANPVVIAAHTVTVTAAAAASSLTLRNGSTVSVNSAVTLAVTGSITHANSITANTIASLTGSGTITAASLTVINTDGVGTGIFTATLNSNITALNISGNLRINSNRGDTDLKLRNGIFNITSGTVRVGGGISTVNENALNNSTLTLANTPQTGTLKIGGATPFSLSATGTNTIALNGTSATVEYYRAGSQTVLARAYTNLTLSGTGTKTLGAAVTISANLSVSGAIAALGTNSFTVNTLSLGGAGVINGTWGSTTSTAKYKTSSFTGTGIVTVSTANCGTLPNVPTGATGGSLCGSGSSSVSVSNPGTGFTIDWYANPTGGSVLAGGAGTAVYTTPILLATTTYYAETRNTIPNCVFASKPAVTVTVNALPAAPIVGTITQPTCATATGAVALSGLPVSAWTVTANPGGATITGSTATADFAGLTAGTAYTFRVKVTASGCTSVASANATINAQPVAPAPPVTGTITQPTCAVTTGTVALGGLPVSSYTVTASPGGATITGSAATANFPGLTAGATYTFTVTITASGCTSAASGNAVINSLPDAPTANAGSDQFVTRNLGYTISGASATNYTSVSWAKTGGIASGILTNANTLSPTFEGTSDGPAVLTFTVTGCGSPVTDQVTLYVVSADPVTWYGAVDNDWHKAGNWFPQFVPLSEYNILIPAGRTNYPTINAAAECKNITIQSGASLIDNSLLTLAAGGKITVEHPAVAYGRWHFISSPVSGVQSGMFAGHYLRTFTPADGYVPVLTASVPLTAMQGFALWPKATNNFTAPFVGGLNKAASYSFTISGAGSDANERFNLVGNPFPSSISWDAPGWTKTGVNNAIYVRDASNWYTYIDGVGVPSGFGPEIAPTQGFFVRASTAGGGSLVMTNAVRVHNNTTFYKKSDVQVPNLVRLKVSGNGYSDETVVRFTSEATAEFDGAYDAEKLYGDVAKAAQIYTLGSTPLAINSLPGQSIVPVGIKTGTDGSYTIAATQVNDLHYVTLEDAETGIFTDLTANPYTFDAVAGVSDQRFKLHFNFLSVEETKNTEAAVYSYQQTVHINMKDVEKGDIYIYNIAGQLVASKLTARGMNEIRLPNAGNYIVKVITKNSTVVRKVFIQ